MSQYDLDSNDDTAMGDVQSEDVNITSGTKRDRSPLFVTQDEDENGSSSSGSRSSKRSKADHEDRVEGHDINSIVCGPQTHREAVFDADANRSELGQDNMEDFSNEPIENIFTEEKFAKTDAFVSALPGLISTTSSSLGGDTNIDDLLANIVSEGKIAAYDALQAEDLPHLAVYHSEYRGIELRYEELCMHVTKVYDSLGGKGFQNPDVENSIRRLRNWSKPKEKYKTVKPVGLLGPAGAGKSSTVVSILSILDVALQSDASDRGTSVVHEYMTAQIDQAEAFIVAVRYCRPVEIKRLVTEHYNHIISYKSIDKNDDDLSRDFLEELKYAHDSALEFFVTLLCDQDDFASEAEAKEYFGHAIQDASEHVIDELTDLIKELLSSKGIATNGYKEEHPADNVSELKGVFRKLSGRPGAVANSDREPLLWPLILKIDIHIHHRLLAKGFVLSDTAGVNDTNQIVAESTRRYLKSCGTIFVFAKAMRIAVNPELDENLRECIRLGMMDNTHLIVTRAEEKKSFDEDERPYLPPAGLSKLQDAERFVNEVEMKQEQARRDHKAKKDVKDFEAIHYANERLEKLEVAHKHAERLVKQATVEIENTRIQERLKSKFQRLNNSDRDPNLKVVCISNSEYQKHLDGYDAQNPPMLDVQATGIPALRAICYSIPTRGKAEKFGRMIRKILPNILRGIIGVLTRSRLEMKQEVADFISTKLDQAEEPLLTAIETNLRAHFQGSTLDLEQGSIREVFSTNKKAWASKADEKLDVWKQYPANTFTAYCRRNGLWKVPKQFEFTREGRKREPNWNVDIQSIYAGKLQRAFNVLDEAIDRVATDTASGLETLYGALEEELKVFPSFSVPAEDHFFQNINEAKERVVDEMEELFHSFRREINMIRSTATIDPRGYVALAMKGTYMECIKLSSDGYDGPPVTYTTKTGKVKTRSGVHAARWYETHKKIVGEGDAVGVMDAIQTQINEAFWRVHKEWQKKWQAAMRKSAEQIKGQFDARFDTTEVKTEGDEESKELLKEEVENAIAKLSKLDEDLAECEAWEKSGGALA